MVPGDLLARSWRYDHIIAGSELPGPGQTGDQHRPVLARREITGGGGEEEEMVPAVPGPVREAGQAGGTEGTGVEIQAGGLSTAQVGRLAGSLAVLRAGVVEKYRESAGH